ncbi:MAG: endopeptidase La, partial [Spirochaetales bacterium]
LLDRTEMIQVSGYTNPEKVTIGMKHLFPKVLEEHGLGDDQLQIQREAMHMVVEKYTREAGVRGLTRHLAKIARVSSTDIVSGGVELPRIVTTDMVTDILGRPMVRLDDIQKESVPGVTTGLAWTPVGGDILFIEGTFMPGSGGLTLTGQLGDVMKESATISMSLVRSRLAHNLAHFDYAKNDVHIHVPAGATPKDGPSAGITIFTALASLILGKPVDRATAMTGEITLRGSVLPVGGIKEKIIAAHRAGVTRVILPKENEKDLDDVPQEVRDDLSFVFVETVEEVLREALGVELPAAAWVMTPSVSPSAPQSA